jgi:Cu/Ag efflux protein CusF
VRLHVPARADERPIRHGRVSLAALACVVLLAMAGAAAEAQSVGGRAPAPRPDWRGTGVVMAILPPPSSLHESRPVIVIDHDPIAGLMNEKMSMPFIAASLDLFAGLKVGDHIAFGLKDVPGALLVVTVERLPPRR